MKKFKPSIMSNSGIVSKTVEDLSSDLQLIRKEQYKALRILLLNLYYDGELLVPRAKQSFGGTRYNPNKLGPSSLRTVLDKLNEYGFINQTIGSIKDGEKKRTVIKRTNKLEKTFIEHHWYVNDQMGHFKTEIHNPNAQTETIILREQKTKAFVNYNDTSTTDAMRQDMETYNKLINLHEISVPDHQGYDDVYHYEGEVITRKFTHLEDQDIEFKYGGRIHSSWCDLSGEMRKRLTIDGEETIELDFQASSINALYRHQTGEIYQDGDPYKLEIANKTIPRSLVKQMSTMIFFTTSVRGLGMALKKYYEQEESNQEKVSAYKTTIKQFKVKNIVDAYQVKHKTISDLFLKNKQTGLNVQFIESELVMGIINDLTKLNIPVLTVYDSFIVQAKHKGLLQGHMFK